LLLLFAHCDYAQWFAETGVLGVGLALVCLASFLLLARRSWRAAPEFAGPALVALGVFALHDCVEFFFHIPGLLMLFALIAALVVAAGDIRPPAGGKRRERGFEHP
jgi:O-antigen ligase